MLDWDTSTWQMVQGKRDNLSLGHLLAIVYYSQLVAAPRSHQPCIY